jgi:4-amino-4-deoxy-L-arabinose transferase-like glycosyltransferase
VVALGALMLAVPLAVLPGFWNAAANPRPYAGDESGWVTAADYYTRLVHREGAGVWDPQPEFGAWGGMTPAFGKLLLGLALPPGNPPIRSFYRFDHPHEWNLKHGGVPPFAAVIAVRRFSALAAIVALALAGAFVAVGFGPGAAIITQALIAVNPIFRSLAVRATPDSAALALSIAAALAGFAALRTAGRTQFLASIAAGALAGLGAATKLNLGVTALLLPTALFASLFLHRPGAPGSTEGRDRRRRVAKLVLVSLAAAGLLHVVSDPYLWHPEARPGFWQKGDPSWRTTPIGRLAHRAADWRQLLRSQQKGARAFPPGVAGIQEKMQLLAGTYSSGAAHGVPLDGFLAAAGVIGLAHRLRRRHAPSPGAIMAGAFVVILGVLSLVLAPMHFGRYFLPPLLAITVLEGTALAIALGALGRILPFRTRSGDRSAVAPTT